MGDHSAIDHTGLTGVGGAAFVGCHVYHNANQAATHNVALALAFNSERFDTDAFHDVSTNNSRLTIPTGKGGKYHLWADGRWASNATGARFLHFRKNGTTLIGSSGGQPSSSSQCDINLSIVVALAAGDYVECLAYQASGGDLDMTYAADYTPNFGLTFLGA